MELDRLRPIQWANQYNLSEFVYIPKSGWHLTYFGNYTQIIQKNKHKAHTFFRKGKYIDMEYQKCQYEICAYTSHGYHSWRLSNVNRSNEYYPTIVRSDLKRKELEDISWSLAEFIYVDDSMFAAYAEYKQRYFPNTKIGNETTQRLHCNKSRV